MKAALSYSLNILCFIAAVLLTFPISIVAIVFNLIGRDTGNIIHTLWGKVWCFLMGIRVEFFGLENVPKKGKILASNHASMFDMLVLSASGLEFVWVSKIEMGRIPVIGWNMWAMGCYLVKRNDPEYDRKVMQRVADDLKKGANVFFFPEGTRTRTGELLPFKKGTFRTALAAGVPIVPIALQGTFDIAPPKTIPKKRGHKVRVFFGKPFWMDSNITLEQNIEKFRQALMELLKQ